MRRALVSLVPLASTLLFAASALAEEAEGSAGHGAATGGHHEAPHVANWWGMFGHPDAPALGWLSLTFITFVVVLLWLLKKPLTLYLEARSDQVKKAIDEAKRAKEAAEARARDAEAALRALDGDIKRMREDFETQGRAEADRIEKMAHDAAVRIQKDAEDTIAAERDRATVLLRQEAARLALELAEERIKGALGASDDARLQKALIDHLSKGAQA